VYEPLTTYSLLRVTGEEDAGRAVAVEDGYRAIAGFAEELA
jgi:hypothetical protein